MKKIFILLIFLSTMLNAKILPPLATSPQYATPQPPISGQPPAPPATPKPIPGTIQPPTQQTLPALQNATLAIKTAKTVKPFITCGKIIVNKAPLGEVELKGVLLYQNVAIGVIHFSPLTGNVLPMGYNEHNFSENYSLNIIKQNLQNIIKGMFIGDFVSYREPESAWVIPIIYNQFQIGEIKVSSDGLKIIPDYPANEEMQLLGR